MSEEETEYKNIDKIGFNIRMDSNIDDLFSRFGKQGARCAIKCHGKISYSLESAGISFPISEESGKAITEKWIRLIERKEKEREESSEDSSADAK